MEIRKSDGGDWENYQEGSYAPDEHNRYLSGVAMDKNGNIGLGYNISSEEVFAGIRYSGRFATDPLGEMTIDEVSVIEGNSTLNTNGRFADYSHICVDPVNETTFWFTSEYAVGGTSRTRIVAFEFSKDTIDLALTSIPEPNSSFDLSSAEFVEVVVVNAGLTDVPAYEVALSLNGQNYETISITDPILVGETKTLVFNNSIDMSQIGDYNLSATVIYDLDQNPNNNTTEKTVTQRTSIDAGLTVTGVQEICSGSTNLNFTITNEGGQLLNSATIDIYLNGMIVGTENWSGNLEFGESETIEYLLTNIPEGMTDYEIVLSHGAGEDLIPSNNTVLYSINSINPSGLVIVQLNTDTYPDETTWSITNSETGIVVAQSPEYQDENTAHVDEFCLDIDQCYTFTINDDYGDGICCGFGDGSYSLINSAGQTIFSATGEFGFTETTNFCLEEICMITAEIEVQDVDVDGTLGSIMITPSGGVAPYTYSIDNGDTFQDSNVFDNLEVGDYVIIVSADGGACTESYNVVVDMISSLQNEFNEVLIKSTPNPNEGFFDLSIENYQADDVFIHFNIHNAQGKLIQSRRMANYSGIYKTQVSLLDYPSGTYFIRFLDSGINQLVKVIKL